MIVVGTLPPQLLLRSSDKTGMAKFEHVVVGDLRRASALRHRKPQWDEGVIWQREGDRLVNLFPASVQQVYNFCRRATGQLLAVDVECTGKEAMACQLIMVGLASASGEALCVPFMVGGGDHFGRYWTPGDEARVREALGWLLLDQRTPKTFQNGAFDTTVLWMEGMPVLGWTEDTMQQHHVLDGEMPHNLGFISSTYLEIPYWKDAAKGDIRWLDVDPVQLRSYNLRDVLTTVRLTPIMGREIKRLGLERLYRTEIKLCHVMRRATWRGLKVDPVRRDSGEVVTQAMIDECTIGGKFDQNCGPKHLWEGFTEPMTQARRFGISPRDVGLPIGFGPRAQKMLDANIKILREIAGHEEFNPNSPDQLQWFLYEHLGFPVVARSEKTQKPSTDKNALVLLTLYVEGDARKEAALGALIKFRKASKKLSTNYRGMQPLTDGRVHPMWKLLPVSGRFSSSPNAQNWDASVKRFFCAEEGHKYVSIDLSQAELREMAYYSGDPDLREMYERGINVHTVNTTLLFQVRCPGFMHVDHGGDQINDQTIEYLRRKCVELLGVDYDSMPEVDGGDKARTKDRWKSMRTLSKNFVFGDNYGAIEETLFDVLRSKRDPNTDEILFPDLTLGEVEALKRAWEMFHPHIPAWWAKMVEHVHKQGYYQSPLSQRILWFRGGIDRNKALNFPIQEAVAAHMERLVEADEYLQQITGGTGVFDMQVHDMVNAEVEERHADEVGEMLPWVFNQPFAFHPPAPFPQYDECYLPADAATQGYFLNEI